MKVTTKISFSILTLLVVLSPNVLASGNHSTTNIPDFKLKPQATFWAFTGEDSFGMAQGMMPLYKGISHNLFAVGEIADSKGSSWFGGAGLGYRMLTNYDSRVFGAYILGDYENTNLDDKFWIVNPGLESLGELWDLRVNGYLPVGSRDKIKQEGFYSELGDWSHAQWVNNYDGTYSIWDERYKQLEQMGYGADLEIARAIPQLYDLKVYLGGYYFGKYDGSPANIEGAEARFNVPIGDHFSFEARDSYDNYNHNTFMVGLKIRLNNFTKAEEKLYGIATRLMDPIEHDIGAFAGSTFGMIPTQRATLSTGELVQVPGFDNVNAIEPGNLGQFDESGNPGVEGNGSIWNPYRGMTPDVLQAIEAKSAKAGKDHAQLLFAPGSYDLISFNNHRVNLPANYSLYGREANYLTPATIADRATLIGGIDIQGVNTILTDQNHGNRFDSIILLNDGSQTMCISADNATGPNLPYVTFNNVDIGNSATLAEKYDYAVLFGNDIDSHLGDSLSNVTLGTINNSNFYGNTNGFVVSTTNNINIGNITTSNFSGTNHYGLIAASESTTGNSGAINFSNIQDSNFSGADSGFKAITYSSTAASGNITLGNISNCIFTDNGTNGYGMDVESDASSGSTGNINIGNIGDITTNNVFTGELGGLLINTAGTGNVTIGNVSNSSFSADINNSNAQSAFEISAGGNITLANGGAIKSSTFTGEVSGIKLSSGNNVTIGNIQNSSFSADINNTGGSAQNGFEISANGNITLANGGAITSSSFIGYIDGMKLVSSTGTITVGDITGTLANPNIFRGGAQANVSAGLDLNSSVSTDIGAITYTDFYYGFKTSSPYAGDIPDFCYAIRTDGVVPTIQNNDWWTLISTSNNNFYNDNGSPRQVTYRKNW